MSAYFTSASFKFLKDLKHSNHREWFRLTAESVGRRETRTRLRANFKASAGESLTAVSAAAVTASCGAGLL